MRNRCAEYLELHAFNYLKSICIVTSTACLTACCPCITVAWDQTSQTKDPLVEPLNVSNCHVTHVYQPDALLSADPSHLEAEHAEGVGGVLGAGELAEVAG